MVSRELETFNAAKSQKATNLQTLKELSFSEVALCGVYKLSLGSVFPRITLWFVACRGEGEGETRIGTRRDISLWQSGRRVVGRRWEERGSESEVLSSEQLTRRCEIGVRA